MTTTFYHVEKDIYGQEGFFDAYKDEQWVGISEDNAAKVSSILSDGSGVQSSSDSSIEHTDGSYVITVTGPLGDALSGLDPKYQEYIKSFVKYVLDSNKGRKRFFVSNVDEET